MATKKLKLVLKANALFSTLSGIALIGFNQQLANIMHLNNGKVLLFIGIGLLLFAGSVFWHASRPEPSPQQVRLIIWQDWGWVLASLLIIITGAFGISTMGYVIIGGVALIVADFAILQRKYLQV